MAKIVYSSLAALAVSILLYYRFSPAWNVRLGKIVHTNSGEVQGSLGISRGSLEYFQWLRIPYAQPPIGNLRFESPVKVKEWNGVLDGTKLGPKCGQMGPLGFEGEEDCLHLNVYVPKLENLKQKRLPVLVWIHGGAFIVGSGVEYTPEYFMDEPVVFVTLNYRLNFFGFFTTGDKNIRGNMGLKDQVLALQWIRENIAKFHGDPQKITIFGESAGGSSVHHLVISQKTKGLFQKAISMSGFATTTWGYRSATDGKRQTQKFAQQLKCPTDNPKKMTDCLKSLSAAELLSVFKEHADNLFIMNPTKKGEILHPIVESVDDEEAFLVESPYEIVKKGKVQRIPWMAGITAHEGLLSSHTFYREPHLLRVVEENWQEIMERTLFIQSFPQKERVEIGTGLKKFYFPHVDDKDKRESQKDEEKAANYTELFSLGCFQSFLSETANIQRNYSPVYLYYFNKTNGLTISPYLAGIGSTWPPYVSAVIFMAKVLMHRFGVTPAPPKHGVCHSDDVFMITPYMSQLLGSVPKDEEDDIYQFSKNFVKMIAQFASDEKSLNFNGVPFPPTPTKGPLKYMLLEDDGKMIDEPSGNRLKIWKSLDLIGKHSATIGKL